MSTDYKYFQNTLIKMKKLRSLSLMNSENFHVSHFCNKAKNVKIIDIRLKPLLILLKKLPFCWNRLCSYFFFLIHKV